VRLTVDGRTACGGETSLFLPGVLALALRSASLGNSRANRTPTRTATRGCVSPGKRLAQEPSLRFPWSNLVEQPAKSATTIQDAAVLPAMSSRPLRCPTMKDLTRERQANIRCYGKAIHHPPPVHRLKAKPPEERARRSTDYDADIVSDTSRALEGLGARLEFMPAARDDSQPSISLETQATQRGESCLRFGNWPDFSSRHRLLREIPVASRHSRSRSIFMCIPGM